MIDSATAKATAAPPGDGPVEHYSLRLYIAGQTPKSLTAIANLKKLAEDNIAGHYTIEVIDLLIDPALAAGDQILAVPTLVRRLPVPLRRIIGTLSDTERVLVGLDIVPIKPTAPIKPATQ